MVCGKAVYGTDIVNLCAFVVTERWLETKRVCDVKGVGTYLF